MKRTGVVFSLASIVSILLLVSVHAFAATMKVYLTSGTSWAGVATNGSNITVEVIGGGGGGGSGQTQAGGGGGEYCESSVPYTSGSTVTGIQIGQGGSGGIYGGPFGQPGTATKWNGNTVVANGGGGGSNTGPGAGGTGGIGTTCFDGGAGGAVANYGSSGAGGAGGPSGSGGAGAASWVYGGGGGGGNGGGAAGAVSPGLGVSASYNFGGNGGNNVGGSGSGTGDTTGGGAVAGMNGAGGGGGYSNNGSTPETAGANGGGGIEWDASHGSGGGGGGAGDSYASGLAIAGGNGGLYGGGGGGGSFIKGAGGNGANGIIVISYTPLGTATSSPTSTPPAAPTISNISTSNVTSNSITITWNTSSPTNGQVNYGATASYGSGSSLVDTNPLATSHTVNLTNLSSSTTYHYDVQSTDAFGSTVVSRDGTFATNAGTSSGAPVISSFSASPSSITLGQSTTLSWNVSGAATVAISNNIGTVSGSLVSVTPSQTTTYTLVATSANGSATAQVTVVVSPPAGNNSPQDLEDWNCGSGATLTPGNPTIVTCPGPHNFTAGTRVGIWNASGGSWQNIDTQWISYLRLNINPSSMQLLTNDTLNFPQTGNFVVSLNVAEQMLVNVANADTLNVIQRGYNGTTPSSYPLESEVIGPVAASASYPITIINANQFSVPFNSTSYGTYSGNPIKIQRESFTYTSTVSPLPAMSIADGVGQVGGQMDGSSNMWDIVLPGCPNPSSANQAAAFECARAYNDPGNQKGYGAYDQVSSLVVNNGVGTVNLKTPFTYLADSGGRTPGPNQLIWLEGLNEGSNGFNSINRPWIMSAINAGATQITISGMGTQGIADGTYLPGNPDSWNGKNIWLPDPLSLYWYLEGDVSNGASFPSGYTQQLVKAGPAFNPLDNRVQMYVCWGKNFTPPANDTGNLELGNYFVPQPSGIDEDHGYQSLNVSGYANQCGLYTFTADSTHFVGQNDPVYNPNDPSFGPVWAPFAGWTGENTYHYWQLVNRWYLNGSGIYSDFSNQTVKIGQMTMNYVPSEPEEYIISRGVIYTGSAYQIALEVNQPGIAAPSYQFRYSTSDMKVAGFSSGLCQNGTTSCGSADSVAADNSGASSFLHYTSAPLAAPSPTIYWAIRPTIPVSGATGIGVSPIWLTTDYNSNMQVGDHITVSGLTGNTAANQNNTTITGIFPRTYWYFTNPSPAWPTGATSGQLVNIVSDGSGNCTVNLTVPHGIQPGWRIVVYGPGSLNGDATHGYRYTVTATPTPNSFIYACTAPAGIYASDTANEYHMFVTAEPGIAIAGIGSGNWSGETGATLVSTDNYKNFAEISFTPPVSSGSSIPIPPAPPSPPTFPAISNLVGSNTTASSILLSWSTNEPTNAQVFYGLTSSYGSSTSLMDTNSMVTSHSVTLMNLLPATAYHFRVADTDVNGNATSSPDFTFTTLAASLPLVPVITGFTATPQSIILGGLSTLAWTIQNTPTALSINQGVGSVLGTTSKSVAPSQTMTYTLTATNAGGSATAQVTVSVSSGTNLPVGTSTAPTITSFTATPSVVAQGGSSLLAWSVLGNPAPTISVSSLGSESGSSASITPGITTIYTLTASNSAGMATAQATVTVNPTPSNPASPSSPSGGGGNSGGGGGGGSSGGVSGGGNSTIFIPSTTSASSTVPTATSPSLSSLEAEIASLLAELKSLVSQAELKGISIPSSVLELFNQGAGTSSATSAISASFTRSLSYGMSGSDIILLQQDLAKSGYFRASDTGYFGSLTLTAVEAFQKKNSIASPGVPGYGIIGPKTAARLSTY